MIEESNNKHINILRMCWENGSENGDKKFSSVPECSQGNPILNRVRLRGGLSHVSKNELNELNGVKIGFQRVFFLINSDFPK